jgi:hypothetical protein
MVPDEADHVAEQRVGLPIRRRRNDPLLRLSLHIRRQLAAVHKLVQREVCHHGAMPRQQVQHLDWLGESHCNRQRSVEAKRALGGNEGARGALEQKQGVRDDVC